MNKTTLIGLVLLVGLGTATVVALKPNQSESQPAFAENTQTSPTDLVQEADTTYNLVTNQSTLEWEASRLVAKPHIGQVSISSGTLLKKDDAFIGGNFVIDMGTISENNNNQRVVDHLSGKDFFNVEGYPTSQFTITSVEGTGKNVEVTGNLTILGKTHAISFPAEFEDNGNTISAQAEFTINRLLWDISYDSGSLFQQLGDKAIKDDIIFRLNLLFSV